MRKRKYEPEEIAAKLRETELLIAQGRTVADAARQIGVTKQSYYRWHREYGGMRPDQAKRLKELKRENARLRRAVLGLHSTLGRVALLLDEDHQARMHLETAITLVAPGTDATLLHRMRGGQEQERAGPLVQHVARQTYPSQNELAQLRRRAAKLTAAVTQGSSAGQDDALDGLAMCALLDSCLAAPDSLLETVYDRAKTLSPPVATALFMAAADYLEGQGDTIGATDALAMANEALPSGVPALRSILTKRLVARNLQRPALRNLVGDAIAAAQGLDDQDRARLQAAFFSQGWFDKSMHGQGLLIAALLQRALNGTLANDQTMIEIGTTRETVSGQGSTEQLAQLCHELGLHFITVDMDPFNTNRARDMFVTHGWTFEAVNATGEAFLAAREEPVDFIFLDAYDFDHGNHSERRQARYEEHLGARIDETECHRMHLTCAKILHNKLGLNGLICFDDTWRNEAGYWTAKGTTAMPYLLANGFELLAERNRAALLQRALP